MRLAIAAPVALLLATGAALWFQLERLSSDARWLDHSDEVLALAYDVERGIIDQETGLRGYELTGDRGYLESYDSAKPRERLEALGALVSDSVSQVSRVKEIRRRYDRWVADVDPFVSSRPPRDPAFVTSQGVFKSDMEAVRSAVLAFVRAEAQLRSDRSHAASLSQSSAGYITLALLVASALAIGLLSRRQLAQIDAAYTLALAGEKDARQAMEDEAWIRGSKAKVSEALIGEPTIEQLGQRILGALAPLMGAEIAAFFVADRGAWVRRAAFGIDPRVTPESFPVGAGLVGRAATGPDVVVVKDVPVGYLALRSGVGEASPREVVLLPCQADGETVAVLELGLLGQLGTRSLEALRRLAETIGLAVRSVEDRTRLVELLDESQRQAEELQSQQEELRVINDELELQRDDLKRAQSQLEERQEELESMNGRLAERSIELAASQREAALRAAEAERASRYKTEFLANMSHELRTPLNSSLILAKLLAENKAGNLTDEQVRFANTIHSAGRDLLVLISDVLDLSKIEAGRVDVRAEVFPLDRLLGSLQRRFDPIARDRKLALELRIEEHGPASMQSDPQRIEQILTNLLSNALKFTDTGGVSLRVQARPGERVAFVVRDSGIGIAPAEQAWIFDAFRLVDAASSRKYGGTGLGLSIARDLATLLGGTLVVESQVGKGSTFTLEVPRVLDHEGAATSSPSTAAAAEVVTPVHRPVGSTEVADDRGALTPGRPVVLVIEDDVPFASILRDLAHDLEFSCLVALDGDSGLALATTYAPSAIVLDVRLPDHSGLSVLDRLKHNPTTRHIPVHVMSVADHAEAALRMGAVGFLLKPADREALAAALRDLEGRFTRRLKRLLIVDDDESERLALERLLGNEAVSIVAASTVDAALEELRKGTFDCVVTDLALPGASGFDLLDRMATDEAYAFPPVIVYTGRTLTIDEEHRLRRHSRSIIVKGSRSRERLLDEVTLFLHEVEAEQPVERRQLLQRVRDREVLFDGRRILIVEDDVRNVFALTSVLESKGAAVVVARNGREALEALQREPGIALVLMDIMMPEMDGLQAMRELRKRPQWAKLPVIALTAKAMEDDRDRCREAGASDFIAKPLDVDVLMSLLRVWMPR